MFKIEGRLVLSEFGVKVFKFEQYFRNGILKIYTINTLNFIVTFNVSHGKLRS